MSIFSQMQDERYYEEKIYKLYQYVLGMYSKGANISYRASYNFIIDYLKYNDFIPDIFPLPVEVETVTKYKKCNKCVKAKAFLKEKCGYDKKIGFLEDLSCIDVDKLYSILNEKAKDKDEE